MSELPETGGQDARTLEPFQDALAVRCSCGRVANIRFNGVQYACSDPTWNYHADPEDESKSRLWNCGGEGHRQEGLMDWDVYTKRPQHVDPAEVQELFRKLSSPDAELQE